MAREGGNLRERERERVGERERERGHEMAGGFLADFIANSTSSDYFQMRRCRMGG